MSRSFAVIGYPLGHSLSPILHNYVFDRLALDASYKSLETPLGALDEVARRLRDGRLAGINITLPYKSTFLRYLDQLAPDALPVGAVNCVALEQDNLIGHNTDVTGILYALRQGSFQAEGLRVMILGAGGAARAAIVALIQQGAEQICIAGRREEAITQLLDDFRKITSKTRLVGQLINPELDTRSFHLIINATPVGMHPNVEKSLLHVSQIHRGQTVFDMVYRPEITQLLQTALAKSCQIITGLDMFIGQGLASLDYWFPGIIYDQGDQLNPAIDVSSVRSLLLEALNYRAPISHVVQKTGDMA
ncbi:MAG: shikimate dehydrogenase [Fidelibacterota bacterium]|nr:MAG: shikimate dehydrogenase [Candidatus Neomarinimicrobiota bacterium]